MAGIIDSKADASKNHFTTGKLIAENVNNQSKWKATSKGGSISVGTGMMGNMLSALGSLGSNMAANSGLITGGKRKHDEESLSHSAISSNIHVNAINGTTGSYLTDTSKANGHLENKFDAQKLSNQLQNSQVGMQLVGEVLGQVSDTLHDAGVWGFDDSSITGNIGRDLLEAGGTAAVAAATGGNVGASVASVIGGKIGGVVAGNAVGKFLGYHFGDNAATELVGNMIMNAASTGAGAALGAAVGGSAGAMNGASIASIINQYNDTAYKLVKKAIQKGVAEQWYAHLEQTEVADHVSDGYRLAFPDKGKGYWDNGKINQDSQVPEEYEIPSDEYLKAHNLGGREELSKLLYHPIDPATNQPTELEAVMYVPKDPDNPLTPPMIIFKGTTNFFGEEGKEDISQAFGQGAPEYNAAQSIGKQLASDYQNSSGPKLIFGGNSLGGGLASAAGSTSGFHTEGTNAAALHSNTVSDPKDHSSHFTYLAPEVLHKLQDEGHSIINTVAGTPIDDPASGTTVDIIQPAPGDVNKNWWEPDLAYYHRGDSIHLAIDHLYNQEKNDLSHIVNGN